MEELLDCAQDENKSVLHLFVGTALEPTSIQRIEVLEQERVSALNWISTELQMVDTVPFRQKPIAIIACSGYLCDHRIAVYMNSHDQQPTLHAIREVNAEMESLEGGLESSNDDAYDERMWALIAQLRSAKDMLVVSECTDRMRTSAIASILTSVDLLANSPWKLDRIVVLRHFLIAVPISIP